MATESPKPDQQDEAIDDVLAPTIQSLKGEQTSNQHHVLQERHPITS